MAKSGNYCYYTDITMKKSWSEAEHTCAQLGHKIDFKPPMDPHFSGHLPAIHDTQTLKFVSTILPSKYTWLGLRVDREFTIRTAARPLIGSAIDQSHCAHASLGCTKVLE